VNKFLKTVKTTYENKERSKEFMGNEHKKGRVDQNKTGMYFSLAVCIVAILIGSVSAIKNKNDLYNNVSLTTKSVVEIRKNQTDVTKQTTVTTQTVPTTVITTAKPTTTSIVANKFVMPVGGRLKKEFSNQKLQYCETYGDWRLHLGVDIAAKKGTDVVSAGKGKVKKVYYDDLYGKTIVIDHGNGVIANYCGVKSVVVSKGDIVEIGERIAVIGEIPCEVADEIHLHFSVKRDSKFVDPIEELELQN